MRSNGHVAQLPTERTTSTERREPTTEAPTTTEEPTTTTTAPPTTTTTVDPEFSNAVQAAEQYLDFGGFSRQGLIDQLSSEYGDQFTREQAEYGASVAFG